MIKLLLKNNIGFTEANNYGYNVFHIIAKKDNISILLMIVNEFERKSFIKQGKLRINDYINSPSILDNQTPLHIAAKNNSVLVAEYLIKNLDADKEAKDYKNRTPLAIAAEFSISY